MTRWGWAPGAVAALVILIAAAGGFLFGRRTIPTPVVPPTQHPVTPPQALPLPVVAIEEPTPTMQTAIYQVTLAPMEAPAVRPTEILPEPTTPPTAPEGLRDQLARCVSFSTSRFGGEVEMSFAVIAVVRATNVCDISFPGQSVWIEVRVIHASGGKPGIAGSQISRFYGNRRDGSQVTGIPARGSAELLVRVDGPEQGGLYQYETSLSSKDDQGRPAYE